MEKQESGLYEKAVDVLNGNWNGKFTIPASTLYPHQWSWDSGFITIGTSYFDTERAIREIEFLYDAQWKNGMVPHIVFNEKEKTYFPAADFYDVKRSENAPKNIGTSGMTQPPVHAISCYYIFQNSKDKSKTIDFLKRIFPKIKYFHKYLMSDRDPEMSGLVTIFHPWESGLDDSPIWDEPLSRIEVKDLPKFKRLDVVAVGGSKAVNTIPSDWEYDKFIYLIELMKKYDYDQKKLYEIFPFKIKDIVFSCILYVANKFLIEIANIISEDTSEIKIWLSRAQHNFYKYFYKSSNNKDSNKLGANEENLFYDYDVVQNKPIKKKTVSSLIPIYTGLISKEEAEVILRWITHAHFCGEGSYCHDPTIPSTDLEVSYFKPITYWRGPVWINTNWMIWLGLQKYGYLQEAKLIRQGVFELVKNHGFREYYDPYKGQGLGGKDFSWTASLVIDMLMDKGIGIAP
jgi:mannosylglycerate hydrolase MGH1-like protein